MATYKSVAHRPSLSAGLVFFFLSFFFFSGFFSFTIPHATVNSEVLVHISSYS